MTQKIIINPYSNVFTYKTKFYQFEKEVRIIIDRFHEDFDVEMTDFGMAIKVHLGFLLRSIVVAPEAPPWFFDLIAEVTKKYGVHAPVRRSMLTKPPL